MLFGNSVWADAPVYHVVIYKSSKTLKLMQDDNVVQQFTIAYGKGGKDTKRIMGDKKTPIGTYTVSDVRKSSRFYYFMQFNYPNLLDAWYGYQNKVINETQFDRVTSAIKKRQLPPQDTELGGYIGIHGLGNISDDKLTIHENVNWTDGCIAITNEEIDYLKEYVGVGTKVVIHD